MFLEDEWIVWIVCELWSPAVNFDSVDVGFFVCVWCAFLIVCFFFLTTLMYRRIRWSEASVMSAITHHRQLCGVDKRSNSVRPFILVFTANHQPPQLGVCGYPKFCSVSDVKYPNRIPTVQKVDIRADGFSDRNCVQSAIQSKGDKNNFSSIQCADKERLTRPKQSLAYRLNAMTLLTCCHCCQRTTVQ